MATTVGSHPVAPFTSPSNGDPLDATVVRANDNTLRTAYVSHDADPGVHVQSSTLATRPAAGTAGRKWMTSDTGAVKLWYDNGATWEEIAYVPTSGAVTFTGSIAVNGNTTLGDATSDTITTTARFVSDLVPSTTNARDLGTTTLRWKDLFLAGNANATGTLTVGGTVLMGATTVSSLNSTGTVTGNLFSGSGASLTNLSAASVVAGNFASGTYTFPGTAQAGTVLATNGQMRAARTTATTTGTTTTLSFTSCNHHRLTLSHNTTLTLSNGVTGGVYTVEILQDGTGGRTLTWANATWAGGAAPAHTTTANRKDVYTFFFDGSNYLGAQFGANFNSTG